MTAPINREDAIPRERVLPTEALAYLLLCLLALAWRLLAIASGPLSPAEAQQALAAYRLAQGSPVAAETVAVTSPALLSIQALTFSLFASNDAWARLPVAILTSLFPLAFWLLRPGLGRTVPIVAALLLCFSPTWTAWGAQALPAELAVVALLFALACAAQAVWKGSSGWAAASGATFGSALASAPEVWSALLLGLITGLLFFRDDWRKSPLWSHWRPFVLSLLTATLVLGTAATFNPLGLQGILDIAARWATSFWKHEPGALLSQVLLLLAYETLLLTLGLAAFAFLLPTNRWRKVLYFWVVGSLLLALLSGSRPGGVLLALPPLALLGADAAIILGKWLLALDRFLRLEGALAATALCGYGYVAVSGIARRGELAYIVLALTAVGIVLALLGLVWAQRGAQVAAAMLGLALLLVLVPWSLANTFQGSWYRRQRATELLYPVVTRSGLLDLRHDVEWLSWSRARHRTSLPMTVERDAGPLVGWYLRDMRVVNWVDRVPPDADTEVLITAGAAPPVLANAYVGQDYLIASDWQPYFASGQGFLSWLLYRKGEGGTDRRVTLWVRDNSQQSAFSVQ
ncbi:MAG: glycosyltransferase family 39 protein [Anaerolineae bacterium]